MLYENLAQFIIKQIEDGTILPGEKLPSLRKISHRFDVSVPTAVEAYRRLEFLGYALAQERSGFIATLPSKSNLSLKATSSSTISRIDHLDEIVRLHGNALDSSFASFGIGTPATEFYPNAILAKHTVKLMRADKECFSHYSLPQGLTPLREFMAKWMKPWIGSYPVDQIYITNGCLEAINLALAVECEKGDIVAVESPCYFGIIQALKNHGLRAVEIETAPNKGIDPEQLEEMAKKYQIKALISSANAQNPLGFTMTDERKKRVLKICERYQMSLIENDVYGELTFKKTRPKTYKYFDKYKLVTYCSSFSKTLGPGLRLGWCIPPKQNEEYLKQKLSLNISSPDFIQKLSLSILKNENIHTFTRKSVEEFKKNTSNYTTVLQNLMDGDIALSTPTGSWFLWAHVKGINSMEIFEKAQKHRIAITPGILFSASGKRHLESFRINCGYRMDAEIIDNLEKLCRIIRG